MTWWARRPQRLAELVRQGVRRCELDLSGRTVVTEAATGAYAATAVLAAAAGGRVTALACAGRFGTADDAESWTGAVAAAVGVADSIEVVRELLPEHLASADVVTNSGHLRPLDARFVEQLKPSAVVPLMMEAWEIGAGREDVDLAALRRRRIAFAGTNERHPAVGVFEYLGVMAVKLLLDAGVPVHGNRVLVLCDNPFRDHLVGTLEACGAAVDVRGDAEQLDDVPAADAVVLALTPTASPALGARELQVLARRMPAVVVAQFYGDVDRDAAAALQVDVWPQEAPRPGHMGILPSAIGPEPIVRLQAGGLKVAQVLLLPDSARTDQERAFLDVL